MRRVLHIIVLVTFVLHAQSIGVMWGLYVFFSDTVAARYCENPTIPSCHGRCHITQLTRDSTKGRPDGPDLSSVPKPPPYLAESHTVFTASLVIQLVSCNVTEPVADGFPSSIDHPPPAFSRT